MNTSEQRESDSHYFGQRKPVNARRLSGYEENYVNPLLPRQHGNSHMKTSGPSVFDKESSGRFDDAVDSDWSRRRSQAAGLTKGQYLNGTLYDVSS